MEVERGNVVEVMTDLSQLVAMTNSPESQTQNNFDVILNIVSKALRIVSIIDANFTDMELCQVTSTFHRAYNVSEMYIYFCRLFLLFRVS